MSYVKLHRKFLEWEWITKPNMVSVFIYMLLKANYETKQWQGTTVLRGQLITGRKQIAKDLGLSEREVRTVLTNLEKTNEIAIQTTNRFSVITINKYDSYQSKEEIERPAERPAERQTIDQLTTTTKDSKEGKEEKNKRFAVPSLLEVEKFIEANKYSVDAAAFVDFYTSKGWKVGNTPMKSWEAAVRMWHSRNSDKTTQQVPKPVINF